MLPFITTYKSVQVSPVQEGFSLVGAAREVRPLLGPTVTKWAKTSLRNADGGRRTGVRQEEAGVRQGEGSLRFRGRPLLPDSTSVMNRCFVLPFMMKGSTSCRWTPASQRLHSLQIHLALVSHVLTRSSAMLCLRSGVRPAAARSRASSVTRPSVYLPLIRRRCRPTR